MTTNNTHLSDLKTGNEAIITKVLGHGAFRKLITEMGFVKGEKVVVSTMGILYQDDLEADADSGSLKEKMMTQTHNKG